MSRPSRNSKPKPDGVGKSPTEIDHVHVERSEIEETGEFDLDGLSVRLAHSIDSIGAKRVVLDTLESLFASLPNEMIPSTKG